MRLRSASARRYRLHRDRSERARLDPELLAELLFLGGETVWRNVGRETAENYGLECALV